MTVLTKDPNMAKSGHFHVFYKIMKKSRKWVNLSDTFLSKSTSIPRFDHFSALLDPLLVPHFDHR